jgi:hypothetical protein
LTATLVASLFILAAPGASAYRVGGSLSERDTEAVSRAVRGPMVLSVERGAPTLTVARSESDPCSTLERCRYLAGKRLRMAHRFELQRNKLRRAIRSRSHKSVWYGLLCIHHYEGPWGIHNPPYDGGLQMDRSFQSTYGRTLLQRYGPAGNWPPEAQLAVGIVAFYSGRGYGPWPNTRRMCGL